MLQHNGRRDPRVRDYLLPTRIVWSTNDESGPHNTERLLSPDPNIGTCVMEFKSAEAPGMLLDFGRELHGGIKITNFITPVQAPVKVRVRFGESVSEAMGTPNNDHAIHNILCEIPWYGSTEIGNTGFRFVRIDLVEPGSRLDLVKVEAVFLYRDLPYLGRFECSDPLLNTIWNTGAYTVHLCMQEHVWDGIKRDRLVWIGDMHPETMVINTVFGHVDVVPDSLDWVRDKTPLPGWMNGISSYSLWWIIIQQCWYFYHADKDYLAQQREYLMGLLKQLHACIGPDHSEKLEGHRFLDWPSSEDPAAIHAGLHSLLIIAFRAAADLCYALEEPQGQNECLAAANSLQLHTPARTASKQASALMALAGVADTKEINADILAAGQYSGISTFYGYYVLQARAEAGDYQGCLDVIRHYWGTMLKLGATTFWEDFNLDWTRNCGTIDAITPDGKKDIHADFGDYCYVGLRHSLCHGWAAGPTAWMSEHVLGIKPLAPGFESVLVKPNLGDLQWAKGALPTPHGLITVSHTRHADGSVMSEVTAPEGIRVTRA
ncbi:MAG: hypothetical protein AMXMBFR84_14350 [Candidatus Hydrogenedentota bacterium]